MPDASTLILVVEVGTRRCGLPADVVVQLHRMVAVVPVPGAPAVVDGVIDVHGTVVAVIDLRTRFGLPPRPVSPDDHLVLAGVQGRTVALRVDRVVDVVAVPVTALAGAVGFSAAPYLQGVARLDAGLLLIHDVHEFLSVEETAALDEALAELEHSRDVEP